MVETRNTPAISIPSIKQRNRRSNCARVSANLVFKLRTTCSRVRCCEGGQTQDLHMYPARAQLPQPGPAPWPLQSNIYFFEAP